MLIRLFPVLLLCSLNFLSCMNSPSKNLASPIAVYPYCLPPSPERTPGDIVFSEKDIEEMELVFNQSPIEAQLIVNHLQDPEFFDNNEEYRSVCFVGEPGSGKTMMANAIAYRMQQHGWKCKVISSTSLLRDYRNQTATQLRRELQSTISSNQPTIIVIDELNRLLENSDSKHHDTDMVATELWTFLDSQKRNPNFFLIGTMNRITKLPKPFKNRILSDYIEFGPMDDMAIKIAFFRKSLTTKRSRLDSDVTDDFLKQQLQKINLTFARDLKKTTAVIHRTQRQETAPENGVMIIKKESIQKTIARHIERREKILYDQKEETDEERQERHHQENMNLQKKHHEEQMLLQKENQELQRVDFGLNQVGNLASLVLKVMT